MTEIDAEALRHELMADRKRHQSEPEDLKQKYAAGSFGCHEALHMASFLDAAVERSLLEHGAILANPAWFEMACRESSALGDLHQAIGGAHLDRDADPVNDGDQITW